jgi:hypothetical protein
VTVSCNNLPNNHTFEADEVDFEVKQFQRGIKENFLDKHFVTFATLIGVVPLQKTGDMFASSLSVLIRL